MGKPAIEKENQVLARVRARQKERERERDEEILYQRTYCFILSSWNVIANTPMENVHTSASKRAPIATSFL
jgi:hypothetical protein